MSAGVTEQQLALDLRAQADEIGRVLACIRDRRGAEAAITIDEIAARTTVHRREIQAIVKILVEERLQPIGSLWRPPYGYYIVSDEAELSRNAWQFLARGVSNMKHGRAFLQPGIAGPILGQLDLFIVAVVPFLEGLSARVRRSAK
jgi:hypothetical protein